MTELRLRKAGPEDIDAMTALDALCFSEPWSRTSFEAELCTNRLARYLLAEGLDSLGQPCCLVGYAGLWAIEDEGHITNVAVHPDFRRMHVGSMLVQNLINWTREEGLTRYTLEARVSNLPAIGLYQQFGFRSVGIRMSYYEDNEDATIMWLEADETNPAEEK